MTKRTVAMRTAMAVRVMFHISSLKENFLAIVITRGLPGEPITSKEQKQQEQI